ncbi:uncharacterized protein LOC142340535 isoform X28 [Convolutriloba macropyga]|uniref:uncharacterized protein LOC142340535 isoform X28 n=1 Tax=Convolutriloba macropyga TaxID=536237 RepID=UPI003F51B69B
MKNMVIRIVLMLALCRGVASLTQRRADIKLENNGYTGILIGVSDDVVPSQKFLDGLERTLADFSDNLFNSTKRRAYLNQITVALPPTWDHFNFSNISSTTEFPTATSKQTIEWANIIVGGQNPSYSDAPYTRQTGECGEPGDYIHLTEKFVTDSAYTTIAFGDVGKLLVREWGHLRWGLFDESGSSDESPTKLFYHGMDGSLHPTRCSAQIEGKPQDAVTGGMCQIGLDTDLPSDTCLFMPDRVQPVGVTGSVMFMHSLPQITEFCDDTADTPDGAKHNAEAPNKQNAMCNGRSAWAVMREHKDFNDGGRERNPSVPAEQARNTRPSIKYVVQRPKEVVFVIDVSTRENVDKVDELRQAVGNYIMNQVQLGTRVGVVTFATTASIVAPLTQVMNETSRGWLVSQLYNDSLALSSTKVGARGATSIGSGLAAAINLISQTGDGTTLDCAEGKENCDQDATALIEEACSYYEQWGKLSNEHVIQYIKMFPERSFTDLETTCKNSQLISDSSSGGDGSDIDPTGDGSSSKVVQDACVNYVANKDFTAAQLTSLNKLFPEKSFTQLTQLCSENDGSELISDNSGRISGDGSNSGISDASTSEVVSEACNYYSKFDDFTAEHISALKTVYPEKTLKQFMQLCSDRNGDAQSELISDTSDASGDGSRPSNGDAISSKVFQEACSYYSSNDDFTTQQLVDLKKLFPGSSLNSLIKLCEQESGSQDELISDTDHNGASNPDNKGDGDQFVSDACDYFLIHGEFRGNDITTLLQLNPDLSFNQLPSLCESGGLPDGGSNSEMTFESVCDEYRRTKNIQGQLIEEQLKMSVLEFISQCSTASKRNRRLALQEGSTEQVTFESVCEEYQRTKIFQGQIIEEQLKMSVIDFISQCQAAQKRSKRDLTNNNMEQNCIDWNEYLELNQNNLQDPIVKAVKQNYDAHCKQVKRLAGNEHGRTRRQQSDDCSLLEKRIETVRDMGDTFLEKMLVESYELKCKSNATKRTIRSVSDDCAKLEERIKNARSSGDSFLEKMLSNNYEQQCTTGAGYSTNSLKLLSERVKRETVTCEQLLDQVNKARQEGNTVVIQVFQEKYDAQCTTQIATGLKRVGRSTDKAEPTCEQLEKRLKDAKGMGMDDFYVTLIQKEYDNKCTSQVVDPSTSGDCSEQNEALKQGIASGLSQNLIRLLRDDLEECQKNNQGGSSGSGGGSSVVVGGDCSAWEDMFDQAQQSGNEQWIEQSRKSLQQCKDAAQSGGSADGGDAGMAGLSCEDIRQLYISSDANSPVRTMLLQKNPTCLAGIEDLVDTESEGGAVSCTSFATVLASLEANPNSDPQTIEGVRKNYQQCLKDGGIDPGSQGGAVACTSFATVLASLEASSNSDPQIVEGVRQKYEQCLKDGGIDPSSQGGAASCSNFATVLSSLEANPNSDPSAIKTVRDSYEQCLEAGGIDPSSQGEGSMLANCESIANTIRLMRQDTSGGSQGGQDEASLEVIKKLQESYAECIEKGGFEIDPTDDQWGGGDTVEKMCASLSASINDLRQESELDSTQQETLQKLQSTYNSVCSSDNGGDGVEKTCASLSAAISNLKQQSTELDFAKQQDLQNFLASYNSLCSDNRGTGVFGGAVSPSSQIVLIVAEEEKMPPFISNIALPSIEAQDIQISTVYASYVKDDPQIGDMVRKTATALYNMYYTYSSFAEGNFAPGQFNLPMQITGLFGSQLIVQKQVKVEDISTHDVTVVPVDGGSHLRVTFAQDTPMTLDILDENGQPSQITTKKVTSKLPTIYVTAPFFIPARAGKRENVDAEYSFSPSSYEQEQKQLQLSGANSDPDTEKIQPVVTMFEHTQTIRFLIPLHRLGQKAIGKWTIKIAAPGDVSSENPLVGTLLVDLPPAQPLLIEKPKPKQVEDKETTDLENESDSSDDESQGTSDKRKRSSMSMPDNEFVNEDPILDEDVMDTQLGAASNNPTNDDSDSDLDTAVDPATKDDVDLTLWKQERVSTIQDYLATREREGNSRIVRVSGKIVDEKRYNAKIVQAEVTWGDWHAVLGARVEAKFECGEPAGSTTSSGNSGSSGDAASSSGTGTTTENYHTRNVVLLDNGANSDVHAGDGIYSAYFVYSGQKRCSARIVVTSSDIDNGKQDSATTITTTTHLRDLGRVTTVDMAPGVIFTRPAKQTVPSFRRELVLESFESTNKKTSSDVIPPARVIDLAVVETSLKEQRVQITFTRPKDDLDQDRLAKNPNHVLYDIRISSNLSAIYSSFNSCFQLKTEHLLLEREDMDLDGSFESPKQFSLLTVHFTVPEEVWLQSPSKVFAVALRANDTLQSGAVSNVVLVAMRDPPTTFVPVFIAALLLIALVLLSGLIYTVRRAARKSATSQGGKIYIHVPNLNKKRLSGGHSGGTKGGNRRGSGGASGGYGMGGVAGGNGGSHSIDMDMESLPKLTTTSQVCVDSY